MLEISNISKSFGEKKVVNNISFNVEKGKIFGLLGRNGAGKSTIFRMILNILKPDAGDVKYNDSVIDESHSDSIGYLPEEGSLILSYTVIEQLLYYGALKSMTEKQIKARAIELLEKFNILEYLNMKIKDLSKGNRQKIQFIIAVLHNPDLIILDEPFSGLDPISVDEFKKIILELRDEGKMIVFSSHRMDHVEMLCEDILIIDKGNEIIKGNLKQIKESYGAHELNVTGEIGKYTFDIIKSTTGVTDAIRTSDNVCKIKVDSKDVIPKVFNLLKSCYITNFATTEVSLNDIFIDKVGSKYEE